MRIKTVAIILGALLIISNCWWAWWAITSALVTDGARPPANRDGEITRVLITLANNPLQAMTAAATVGELQARLPDLAVKVHGDTVEVSDLLMVFGPNGVQSIARM